MDETNKDDGRMLEYSKPEKRSAGKIVALVFAILFALGVGLLCYLALVIMGTDRYGQSYKAAILGIGILVFIGGTIILARMLSWSAAAAVAIVALCSLLLMIGVCSTFRFSLH